MRHALRALTIAALFFLPGSVANARTAAYAPAHVTPATPANPVNALVTAPRDDNARLLKAGEKSRLTVDITGLTGRPLAGKAVTFTAPSSGPNGSFAGGTGPHHTIFHTRTNGQGVASADLTENNLAGPYLVDVRLPGTEDFTTFAISGSPTVVPTLGPAAARALIVHSVLGSEKQGRDVQLYGPVLLPAGSSIITPAPAPALSNPTKVPAAPATAQITLKQPTWLAWSDKTFDARFGHPTHIITVNAKGNRPGVHQFTSAWFPSIRPPHGTQAQPLVPPVRATASPSGPAPVPASSNCAIVVYGYDQSDMAKDAAHMAALLRSKGVTVYTTADVRDPRPSTEPPASEDDLKNLIKKVQSDPNCKHLYIYVSSHGWGAGGVKDGGGVVLWSEKPEGKDKTHIQYLYYTYLGFLLQQLRSQGMDFNIIVDACYSGSLIPVMDDYGITGNMVTSSDATHTSMSALTFSGGMFTNALIDAWNNPANDTNHDGTVSLSEAAAAVPRDTYNPFLIRQTPTTAVVTAHNPTSYTTPVVYVEGKGFSQMLVVTRPPGVPLTHPYSATVSLADGRAATIAPGVTSKLIYLPAGQQSTGIEVDGVANGVTTYTVSGSDDWMPGYPFQATAALYVGSDILVQPDVVQMDVGQTATVTVTLGGVLAQKLVNAPNYTATLNITIGDPSIATPETSVLVVPHGQTHATFLIEGDKPGTTTVTVTEPDGNVVGTATVVVNAPETAAPPTFTEYQLPIANAGPYGMTFGPDGAFWFTEIITPGIGRITTNGTITEFPLPDPNSLPESIITGPDGNLWFTDPLASSIGTITPQGKITEFPLPNKASFPTQIANGQDGNLYFTDEGTDAIGKITVQGQVTEYPVPTKGADVYGIAAGPGGNIFFTYVKSPAIGMMTPDGTIKEFPIPGNNPAPSNGHTGSDSIVANPDGTLDFTYEAGNAVGVLHPTTGAIDLHTLPTANAGPFSLAVTSGGSLALTESNVDRVALISPSWQVSEVGLSSGSGLGSLAVGASGGTEWYAVTEGKTDKIALGH